jgi:hypothetical protein
MSKMAIEINVITCKFFQCCMHMSKIAVVIDMHIQFITDLAVLFGVQLRIIKKNMHL